MLIEGIDTVLEVPVLGGAIRALSSAFDRLRVSVFATDTMRFIPILPDLVSTRLQEQGIFIDPRSPSYLVVPMLGEPGW